MMTISKEVYEELPEPNKKGYILCTSHVSICEEFDPEHYIFAPNVPEWARKHPQPDPEESC